MGSIKFHNGNIATCICRLKRKIDGKWVIKNDCKVRIISINDDSIPNYRVYNITFHRYEVIGHRYLKKDLEYERENKIKNILE